jgi:5-methylcytosine-specific restriction endonuclease McrA
MPSLTRTFCWKIEKHSVLPVVDEAHIRARSRWKQRLWSPQVVVVSDFTATSSVRPIAYVANTRREDQYTCTVCMIQKNGKVGLSADFASF